MSSPSPSVPACDDKGSVTSAPSTAELEHLSSLVVHLHANIAQIHDAYSDLFSETEASVEASCSYADQHLELLRETSLDAKVAAESSSAQGLAMIQNCSALEVQLRSIPDVSKRV